MAILVSDGVTTPRGDQEAGAVIITSIKASDSSNPPQGGGGTPRPDGGQMYPRGVVTERPSS